MKFLLALVASITFYSGWAQNEKGRVTGVLLDDAKKTLSGASISLTNLQESAKQTVLTANDGSFIFPVVGLGYYKLTASFVGFSTLTIDSIHLHQDQVKIMC